MLRGLLSCSTPIMVLYVLLVLCIVVPRVSALDDIEIVAPVALRTAFGVDGRITDRPAMFGIPKYGSKLIGPVVYATWKDTDGCTPIDKSLSKRWPSASDGSAGAGQSIIVMVDRGDCDFVTKAAHAQAAGAAAMIVIDDRDRGDEELFMWDDGHGAAITIPCILIKKSDGAKIIDVLEDPNETVVMSMAWRVPHHDNVVRWDYWTSSDDDGSREFKKTFIDVVKSLGTSLELKIHYMHHQWGQGPQCWDTSRKYCADDPDGVYGKGKSGRDVLEENLRQMCVYQTSNTTTHLQWWMYVDEFNTQCMKASSKPLFQEWTPQCVSKALSKVGVDEERVNACMKQSWKDGSSNTLFDANAALVRKQFVFTTPMHIVNGVPYHGTSRCAAPIDVSRCGVLEEICAGYRSDQMPEACNSEPGCALGQKRDSCGVCGGDGTECGANTTVHAGLSAGWIVFLVLLVISVIGLAVFCYLRRHQDQILEDVDDLLKQYYPMDHSGAGKTEAAAAPANAMAAATASGGGGDGGGGDGGNQYV